ncbi:sulfotransferase [Algicella marina]|uniref:sulfotransferase n=1 Tax=Algicella marina TaxID=2683284 RepID=UPI00137A5E8B|nr:sulfotransferase [Algicella marina]
MTSAPEAIPEIETASGRRLDYIVFGLARSGTTGVTRYLNAVPEIYCGVELFKPSEDHSALYVPECLINVPDTEATKAKVRISREKLERDGDRIQAYGNKTPEYFYNLATVLSQLEKKRGIFCYRNIRDVARSYSTRAQNVNDNWHPGRLGVYVVADAILLYRALSRLDQDADILVVPYNALDEDWQPVMESASRFLLPDVQPTFTDEVVQEAADRKKIAKSKDQAALTALEEDALSRIDVEGIHQLLNRPEPFRLNQVRGEIKEIVRKMPKAPLKIVREIIDAHDSAPARDFFRTYKRRSRFALPQRGTANA